MPATRRRPTKAELRADVIVAAILALVSAVIGVLGHLARYMVVDDDMPAWVFVVTSIAMAAPLAVRRVWPWFPAIATSAMYIVFGQLGMVELTVSQVIMFLAVYSVGAWDPSRRRAKWVRLAIVAAMFTWLGWSYGAAIAETPADGFEP